MIKEILRFLTVGLVSNLVNFITYSFLYFIGISLFICSCIGYVIGISISYIGGRSWVFKADIASTRKTLTKFFLVYLCGGIGMTTLIVVLTNYFYFDYKVSWLIGAFYAVINNFLGQKLIVFNRTEIDYGH